MGWMGYSLEVLDEELKARTFHVRAVTLVNMGGPSRRHLSFYNTTTIMRHVRLC
jgi:hypothetical protein